MDAGILGQGEKGADQNGVGRISLPPEELGGKGRIIVQKPNNVALGVDIKKGLFQPFNFNI
jgi:hypothetical protein